MPAAAHRGSLRARIADGDRALMARIHATHSTALDRVMPALSQAANHSVLWFCVAAGLAASRDKWGVDSALRTLARTPAGPWLLVAVAAGLVLFGTYSFCESRWREV